MSRHGPLPTASQIVSSLLSRLDAAMSEPEAGLEKSSVADEPRQLSPDTKELFLTLHVLLPHYLLDALDLLDRGLVMRITSPRLVRDSRPATEYYVRSARNVPSASSWRDRTQRGRKEEDNSKDITTESYHVRLHAWHCSCPGFAYAAHTMPLQLNHTPRETIPGAPSGDAAALEIPEDFRSERSTGDESCLSFGVLHPINMNTVSHTSGVQPDGADMPPVCKHLLACALAERCDRLFRNNTITDTVQPDGGHRRGVKEVRLSELETAGWAAGGWHSEA